MPAYLIGRIAVKDWDKLTDYRARVGAVVERFGGRYLALGGEFDTMAGDWGDRAVLIEFPTAAAGRAYWTSGAYAELKVLFQDAAELDIVLIEGLQGAAPTTIG